MSILKTLTDGELMDKLLLHKIPESGTFICDQCGAYSNDLSQLRHETWCPDMREVPHGD